MVEKVVRHLIAACFVGCAAFSGTLLFLLSFGNASDFFSDRFINLIWGLLYGIGFEPALIWYQIHGPYPLNFIDLFGLCIWPIGFSIFLYIFVLRVLAMADNAWRKRILACLLVSFVVIIPFRELAPTTMLAFPLWPDGYLFSSP
jgi:hypothetical protein